VIVVTGKGDLSMTKGGPVTQESKEVVGGLERHAPRHKLPAPVVCGRNTHCHRRR
jgi:hypothetical protein